ncbi:hypothetical protein GCM10009647_087690 [Streptomyces sanglieri]
MAVVCLISHSPGMHPYIAIEIDGVLSPYDGPLPAGHSLHDVTSAAWQEWAAMVYPRPRGLRLALNAEVGRAYTPR